MLLAAAVPPPLVKFSDNPSTFEIAALSSGRQCQDTSQNDFKN